MNYHRSGVFRMSLQEITLKKSEPSDWKAILALYASLDEDDLEYRFFNVHHVFPREAQQMASQKEHCTLLAFADEIPVGEACLESDGEVSVVVARDWRHRGVASLLFKELIAIARDRGLHKVWFMTLTRNASMIELGRMFDFRVVLHSSQEEEWVLDLSS